MSQATATTTAIASRQQEVLTNHDLLAEIVAFLPSAKDCRHTLLVNHLWRKALTSANTWQHILLGQYPSMQCFLPSSSPTPMTAKGLLSVRLVGDNHKANKKRELRRLKRTFRNKSVTLLLSHPTHGRVASCNIPIHFGENHKEFLEHSHALTIHERLSVLEYLDCEMVMQLVPGVDFIRCASYEVADVEDLKEEGGDSTKLSWYFLPQALDFLDAKFTGFLHDNFETPHNPSFDFDLKCTYPKDVHIAIADEIMPNVVEGSIIILMDEYDISSAFGYLKLMATWFTASRHMRPISTELSRLQQRFQHTYILIEVEDEDGSQCAFALVPFADEAALLALFQTQTTRLQLVNGGDNFPDYEGGRVAKVSILDLGSKNRLIKLSRGSMDDTEYFCQLEFLEQSADFDLSVRETKQDRKNSTDADTTRPAPLIKLSVVTSVYGTDLDEEQQFATILDLYKILEIVIAAAGGGM